MPLIAAAGTVVLIVFLLWFVVGTQRNVTRGNDLLRWLQGGLPRLGRRTRLRWFGSSAVRLDIVEPEPPFTAVQVSVVLEPRDLGWLWAWARRRGRRDFLVLRGTLPGPPRFELEAGDRRGWTGSDGLDGLDLDRWFRPTWPASGGPVEVAHSQEADVESVREAWDALATMSRGVWRLSIRNVPPLVEAHVEPPDPKLAGPGGAEALVGAFRDLGRLVARPRS
jgi:hypothetical protein